MSLMSDLSRKFPERVRLRGEAYQRDGRVGPVRHAHGFASAEVIGSTGLWEVRFHEEAGFAVCNCPAFDRYGVCKHLWALICQLDSSRRVPQAGAWRDALRHLRDVEAERTASLQEEIAYVLGEYDSREEAIGLEVIRRRRRKNGSWGKFVPFRAVDLAPPGDRRLIGLLQGARRRVAGWRARYRSDGHSANLDVMLGADTLGELVPELVATGRFYRDEPTRRGARPLRIDDGEPWRLHARVAPETEHRPHAELRRGTQVLALSDLEPVAPTGWVLDGRTFHRVEPPDAATWLTWFRHCDFVVDAGELDEFYAEAQMSFLGEVLEPPPGWKRLEAGEVAIRPVLSLDFVEGKILADVLFDYDGAGRCRGDEGRGIDLEGKRVFERDRAREDAARADLAALIGEPATPRGFALPVDRLAEVVGTLIERGWKVEGSGARLRTSNGVRARVSSGIDWFDLEGGIEFGEGQWVSFPRLLAALRRGEKTVRLGDGTLGLLPEEWVRRRRLLEAADADDDTLRFKRNQGLLIDLLLESAPAPELDAKYRKVQAALRDFDGVAPAAEPRGFAGTLRPYQKEGLGWLGFLHRFGFGGCLADDMGLGKTVQLLAWIQARKLKRSVRGPTLVVAPRSVTTNWLGEAERFAPRLAVVDYTGTDRAERFSEIADADLVVTTYGLVRRDIEPLREIQFGCAVLDEAQAIKNAKSQTAKACRLLQADQRLALSGTPIENHLDDLWSLCEFLNPGMFGSIELLRELGDGTAESRRELAQLIRPFILRRRKEEVASDLPPRIEQTLTCVLPPRQRKLYDQLLTHYRASVLGKVADVGLGRAKLHVLEALTRLRQAACHPALIDETVRISKTAKIDTLIAHLEEVISEGHKALVFSQFTKFLAIVRRRLDAAGLAYEYLDGKTRDRQQRIDRFQQDESCPLFLISLKAGGTGLNLTAADYVFLLDPWWNPAVEAQAIDRTHRIGQTRQVFAYRLIAEDTIEEKILALQEEKRDLARAILDGGGGSRTLRDLTREDLERLFA